MTSAPRYLSSVMANEVDLVGALSLDAHEKARVLSMCAVCASASSPAWVSLMASWGFDLQGPAVIVGPEALEGGPNWLWLALARGKLAQARELVRLGFKAVHVHPQSGSGLLALTTITAADTVEAYLDLVAYLGQNGLAWETWPDADLIAQAFEKNIGKALAHCLADRQGGDLSSYTGAAMGSSLPVRI